MPRSSVRDENAQAIATLLNGHHHSFNEDGVSFGRVTLRKFDGILEISYLVTPATLGPEVYIRPALADYEVEKIWDWNPDAVQTQQIQYEQAQRAIEAKLRKIAATLAVEPDIQTQDNADHSNGTFFSLKIDLSAPELGPKLKTLLAEQTEQGGKQYKKKILNDIKTFKEAMTPAEKKIFLDECAAAMGVQASINVQGAASVRNKRP